MTHKQTKTSEAHNLATKVAGRYGKLALSRAAGEAASAKKNGDHEAHDLWKSVTSYLRQTILNEKQVVTA